MPSPAQVATMIASTAEQWLRTAPETRKPPMTFLHARIHRERFHEIVSALTALGVQPAEPLTLRCPNCTTEVFLDLEPTPESLVEASRRRATLTWTVRRRLSRECPDHAHRFEIAT
jgi:hypothetical protein